MGHCQDHLEPSADGALTPASGMAISRRRGGSSGIVLIQVIVAMSIIVMCGAGGLLALIEMNRMAAAMRTLNQARSVVQRNIDTAMGTAFTKDSVPPILALTAGSTTTENIIVSHVGNNVVTGQMTRIVTAVTSTTNADIRRVTFRLAYSYRTKPYSYEMSTIRSAD